MKQALVIVDIQNDYFAEGRFPLYSPEKAVQKAHLVLEQCRAKGMPVIHVQHINPKGSPFFEPDTKGIEIHPLVKPKIGEVIVVKHYPNSFKGTTLKAELDALGVDKLIIMGMMTHMCIDTTTRVAKDLGYDCTILADCCATRSLQYAGITVDAVSVQISYLGALEGYFADVVESEKFKL